MRRKNPKTPAEWQEALDAATACRALYDVSLYGLITIPPINAERCDFIIEQATRLGYRASAPATDLAVALWSQMNAKAAGA